LIVRSDSWQVEKRFVPRDLEEAQELREVLIAAGNSAAIANGIVGWLLDKALSDVDRTALQTRTDYRKVLAELDGRWPPKKRRRRRVDVVALTEAFREAGLEPAEASRAAQAASKPPIIYLM